MQLGSRASRGGLHTNNVSSITKSQVLTYNSTTSKWTNQSTFTYDIQVSQSIAINASYSPIYNDTNNENNFAMINGLSQNNIHVNNPNLVQTSQTVVNLGNTQEDVYFSGSVGGNNLPIVINWYFSSPVVISTLTVTYGTSNTYYYPQNFVLYFSNYSSSDTNRFATSNMTQLFSESNILTNYTNSSVYNQSSTGTTSHLVELKTQFRLNTLMEGLTPPLIAHTLYWLIHVSPMEVLELLLFITTTNFQL